MGSASARLSARAVWFSAPRQVELRSEAIGEPGPGQALVRAELSAISAGSELLVYRGEAPPDLPPDLPTVAGSFGLPVKFGYASVGRVERLGPGGSELTVGQRVFALHPHQSRFVAPLSLLVPLPPALAPEVGLFFANLETAFNVLLDAHPRLGERVVVFGLGVVGLLVVSLLRLTGPELLVGVDPLAARRAAAVPRGATLVLAPAEADVATLRELAGGQGFDLAIEASGNPDALQAAVDAVGFQGTVLACGWYGRKAATLMLGERFHRERLRLVSSQVSNLDPALAPRWDRARRAANVLRLLERVAPAELISHRVPLEQAAQAYRLLDEQPGQALQVVLTYDPTEAAGA
jgi:2-desacetyl-2-hydroxyethyl bacteriochlorophyllide A dehydrogenase